MPGFRRIRCSFDRATDAALIIVCALLANTLGCSPRSASGGGQTMPPPVFIDTTREAKLDFVHDAGVDGSYFMPEHLGAGCGFIDYDNDGDLDIYLVDSGPHGHDGNATAPHSRLYRQEADHTFTDVTAAAGLAGTGYGMGMAVGDFDNDGYPDIYVAALGSDSLYRNNGNGTFTNVSARAGIRDSAWGTSATFVDYDGDGFLDIYVADYVHPKADRPCLDSSGRQEYCGPRTFEAAHDILYHNNGNGTFSDVSQAAGITKVAGRGLGVVVGDFNGDGRPDIFVANDSDPNILWINQGDGTFKDDALFAGAAVDMMGYAGAGMGVALGDVDNDGRPDLYVTHLREENNVLYRNMGADGFRDDTAVSGLSALTLAFTGFGTGFLDFDNDGNLDLAIANGRITRGPLLHKSSPPSPWDAYGEPNVLVRGDGHGHFNDACTAGDAFCHAIENHRCLAFGDVDNDGRVDLLTSGGGSRARLFLNRSTSAGHWLLVRAVDAARKRDAIGAVLTVMAGGRSFSRWITPGYSYLASNDPRAHFGLGSATAIERIEVRWPDGTHETFPGGATDRIVTLTKGGGQRT
jgi:hypothetical protein